MFRWKVDENNFRLHTYVFWFINVFFVMTVTTSHDPALFRNSTEDFLVYFIVIFFLIE